MKNQTGSVWLTLGAIVGVALAVPAFHTHLFDDAYIHARIANNIWTYGIPIFNRGDIFEVDSSTGYVYLVAILSRIFGTLTAIRVIESVSIFVTVMGLSHLVGAAEEGGARKLIAAACVLPFLLLAAYGGMESAVFCALLTAAAIAHFYGKEGLALALISLCTWIRFEAILLLCITLVYYLYTRKLSKRILLFSFPFVALVAVELFYFGTIVPYAALVKSTAYGFPITQSVRNALSFGFGPDYEGLGVFYCVYLFLNGLLLLRRKLLLRFADVLVLFSAGVYAAWMVGRSLIFPWYYIILVFPVGAAAVLRSQESLCGYDYVVRLLRAAEIVILIGFGALGAKALAASLGLFGYTPISIRVARYLEIGRSLYSYCPNCTLATSEIGGLGYSFRGTVYDGFGLADPVAARFQPLKVPSQRQGYGIGAIPPLYVAYRNPDFVVSMPVFTMALRKSQVLKQYVQYDCPIGDKGRVTIFGDQIINIWSKKKLPASVVTDMKCYRSRR